MLAGTIGTLSLLPGDLALGAVHLGVHTMLYAAMGILIGYQAVTFAKVFMIAERLLPVRDWIVRLCVEAGLVVVLTAAGGRRRYVVPFSYWSFTTFGALRPEKMLRIVIPAALTLVLGCQTILSSFFLSVLGLRVRRTPRDHAKTEW